MLQMIYEYSISNLFCRLLGSPLKSTELFLLHLFTVVAGGFFLVFLVISWHGQYGAIQVLRNTDGGGGCLIFWKKALRRCNVQCY